MDMQGVISIVGAVSGMVSLIGFVLVAGVWKGRVDADRAAWNKTCQAYPPGEIWMMCKTMWDIYVVDILHQRPDLAEKKSPWRLKQLGKDLIPSVIKEQLDLIPEQTVCKEDISNGWLVVKLIGLNHISDMAKEKKVTVQEAVAILSTYLDELLDNRTSYRC